MVKMTDTDKQRAARVCPAGGGHQPEAATDPKTGAETYACTKCKASWPRAELHDLLSRAT